MKDTFSISESSITFDSLRKELSRDKPYFQELYNADILVLPYKSFKEYNSPVFSEETESFVYHAKNELLNKPANIELFMQDDKYEELELHADTVNIPLLIWDYLVHPIAIGLVVNYVTGLIKQRNQQVDIKLESIITKNEKSRKISFSGSINDWKEAMESLPKDFWDDDIK